MSTTSAVDRQMIHRWMRGGRQLGSTAKSYFRRIRKGNIGQFAAQMRLFLVVVRIRVFHKALYTGV